MATWGAGMPRSPGHTFYDQLQELLWGRVRRVRGRSVQALLRSEDGRIPSHSLASDKRSENPDGAGLDVRDGGAISV